MNPKAWREPLVMPALGLGLGLTLPDLCSGSRAQSALLFASCLALGLVGIRRRRRETWIALAAAGFALGGYVARRPVPPQRDLAWRAGHLPGPVVLVGRVLAPPAAVPGSVSIDLAVESVREGDRLQPASGWVRARIGGFPEEGAPVPPWRAGDLLELSGMLALPRDFATPGAPSRALALARRGIGSQLLVKSPRLVIEHRAVGSVWVARVREHVQRTVDVRVGDGRRLVPVPGEEQRIEVVPPAREAALLKAMLVDDRALVDEETTRKLAEAGILHVLSISGLHVALAVGAVYGLLAWLGFGERVRIPISLAVGWGYVLVAASPLPAVRSALLSSVVLVSRLLLRDATPGNALAMSFLVAGLLEPFAIGDAGFQMTFAAAFGLSILAPPIAGMLGRVLPRWLAAALAASLGSEVAVLPIAAHHFGRLALAGPLVNLLAVPLAALDLLLGFLLVLVEPLSGRAAAGIGWLLRPLLGLLLDLAEPRVWPWVYRFAPTPLGLAWIGGTLLVLAVLLGRSRRPRSAVVAVVMACGVLFLGRPIAPHDGLTRIHVLDVGQGDALLVEHASGATLLVDAGGFPHSSFDVGDRVVVPFLLARGVRRLDLAAVTHAHPDHAAGMRAVLRDLEVGELWLSDDPPDDPLVLSLEALGRRRGVAMERARRGRQALGGALRVLGPPAGLGPPARVENSRSLVLRVETAGGPAFLTGDIHADAEAGLLELGEAQPACLLKVAHHGSATSSSAGWIAGLRPRLAVISCGFENRFGHPDAAVLERLRDVGASVRRTDLDGAVTVTVDGQGHLLVSSARARFRP